MSKRIIYLKRIMSDIQEIASLYDEYIHISFSESDTTKIKCLIIGPKDTPYEDGFFFFDINIPKTYPFDHPSVNFETINSNIRFNPNLYESGKVCLSIIGTWSGPKWSSIQTLNSLLLSIQSLLNENPINNEPSFEHINPDDPQSKQYNEYVRFHTYDFSIYQMLNNKKSFGNIYFKNVIEHYFVTNYENIIKKLEKYKELDGQVMKTFIWGHQVTINYKDLIIKYNKLYQTLKDKDFSNFKKTSVHNFDIDDKGEIIIKFN